MKYNTLKPILMPNFNKALGIIVFILFLFISHNAHAVLISGLAGEVKAPIKATSEATTEAIVLNWAQGVENSGASIPWAWAFAATAAGFDVQSASGAPIAHAHADAPTSYIPPGHAWADAFAKSTPPLSISPKADATWYAVSRARAGIGKNGASAGHTMSGLIQFLVSNIILDPLSYPPGYNVDADPELGTMLSTPAVLDIVGSVIPNNDMDNVLELFRIHTALTVDANSQLDLIINDPTGTFTKSDFEYFNNSNGEGYSLINPKTVSFSFTKDHTYLDGTNLSLDLSVDAIASSTIPEPSILLLLGSGLAGLLTIKKHQRYENI